MVVRADRAFEAKRELAACYAVVKVSYRLSSL